LPTYFVCGTNDGLLGINESAYSLLEDAGNENIEFVTFVGAHDYLEENVLNMYLWMREFVNEDYDGIEEPGLNPYLSHPSLIIIPNPVLTEATIRFNLPLDGKIILEIYDQMGRSRGIIENDYKAAGVYAIQWNRGNLASGIYYCRLSGNRISVTKQLVVH
jgi:hypothetical protein